ncbi:MAG: hypothetical protein KDK37_09060 [Leptospiraceae bacterium]|nr:hypothetical protein [Leptospiraceae bacterium]MCB1304415.1 hypothetical protein [Leptospiraceae bacterium]
MVQRFRVILLICLGSIFSSCYTAEFQPHPDYPGRRPLKVESSTLADSCYETRGQYLGTLLIRNFQGDLKNPGFRNYVLSEMEDHGANFGCVRSRSVSQEELYQVQNKSMHSNKVQTGEPLEKKVGTMEIRLYYDSEEP